MSDPSNTPELDTQARFDVALKELRGKQRQFVLEYLKDLNGKRAAIRAGYSEKTAEVQASQILRILKVAEAVSFGLELKCMGPTEVLARLSAHARGDMADFLRVDEEDVLIDMNLAMLTDAEVAMLALSGTDAVRELLDPQPTGEDDDNESSQQKAASSKRKPVRITTMTVKRQVARLDLLQAADKLNLIKKYSIDDKGKVAIELYDAQAANKLIGQKHGLFVEKHEFSGPNGDPIPVKVYERNDDFDPDGA